LVPKENLILGSPSPPLEKEKEIDLSKFITHSLFAKSIKSEYNIPSNNHKGQFNKSPRGRVYRQEIIERN
tara:strand:+ start:1391 stop:1600 length:210 start_codon:yes stop_codon:yes gene_type:complete